MNTKSKSYTKDRKDFIKAVILNCLPVAQVVSDEKLSKITGIPTATLRVRRVGEQPLGRFEEYLKNYIIRDNKWVKIGDEQVPIYSGRLSDRTVSRDTGVPEWALHRIRHQIGNNDCYLPYLTNYKCVNKRWKKVNSEKVPLFIKSDSLNKLTDVQVSKLTGVHRTTLGCFRRGVYKTTKFSPYLKNFSCEKGYWEQIGDKPCEYYVPPAKDNNPNKISQREVSRRTGISVDVLKCIRHNMAPEKNAAMYFKKLRNYSWSKGYWEQISDAPEPLIDLDLDSSISVYDLYCKYVEVSPNHAANKIKSVLVRYFVPYIGGQTPTLKRATDLEIDAALNFLKSVPAQNLNNMKEVVSQAIEQSGITGNNAYSIRNTVKKFVEHEEIVCAYKYLDNYNRIKEWEESSPSANPNRKTKPVYGLKVKPCFRLTGRNPQGKLVHSSDYINDRLKQQIAEIQNHYSGKVTSASLGKINEKILEFCGWLVRFKSADYESLCLESIIQYAPLNVDMTEFPEISSPDPQLRNKAWQDYILRKAMVREYAFVTARKNILLIKEYCDFVGNKASTALVFTNVAQSIAKYVYRKDFSIYSEEYTSHKDLPITKKLLALDRELEERKAVEGAAIPHDWKSEPWHVVVEALDKIRRLFHIKRCRYHQLRSNGATSQNLQKFLALGFLVLLPPDRSRSLYDMRIGKTLVKGVFDGSKFYPECDENQNESKWYRYLGELDYKTGKIYKDHIYLVPNYKFPDGKCFYEYIDTWLNWGRNQKQPCDHDYFFRKTTDYQPVKSGHIHGWITTLFSGYGYKSVTPHTLRNSYITWLMNQKDASPEIKESLAVLQHHSVDQQRQYDKNSNYQKSLIGYEYHQNSLDKLFWTVTNDRLTANIP